MTPGSQPSTPAAAVPVSRGYAAYVLAVLFAVYVFNFVDRQVLSILMQPIKDDLQVPSDAWMGFLAGPVFAIFYTLAGVPIARFADRGVRKPVVAASLAVWSAMTAAQGLAQQFWQLALTRLGVGIGEAGGTPPSHSLISDYFPPEQRATALALYGNGVYLGSGLGIMAGGALLEMFGDWRTAFIAVGLAGLPLALLVALTVRELPRGASEGPARAGETAGIGSVLRFLFARRSFVWLVLGSCGLSVFGYAILNWGAIFLGRVHGMPNPEIARWLGPTIMLGGCAGISVGGWLADRLGARDARWYMRMPAVASVAMTPFAVGFLVADDPRTALVWLVVAYALGNMYVGPLWSTTQNLARPEMRATASAVLLLILNVVGLGMGPLLVGVLNDALAPRFGDEGVRWSLLVVTCMEGLGGVLLWVGSASLPADLAARDT